MPNPPKTYLPALLFTLLCAGASSLHADDFDREPIRYRDSEPNNIVSRLQQRLDAGKAQLTFTEGTGYLRSLLEQLGVPISSQTLVFSKTSLQRQRIAPQSPRALYFNDDVYVGFCKNGDVLEVSAVDSKLGTVFYSLDQRQSKPRFQRQTDNCLLCHGSSQTHGVPGHIVRSVFPDPQGLPILSGGTQRVDQTTPLEKRWGGWYVTGTHGKQAHLGNLIVHTRTVPDSIDNSAGLNVRDLKDRVWLDGYLSNHSDIVALMVLEHQADMHNLLTQASFTTRQALHQEETLNREMKLPPTYRWDSTRVRIHSVGDDLLRYMLFSQEAKFQDRIRGSSTFAEEFARRGPRDGKGRSLFQFDLEKRLFRYPCSYLVYSEAFDALPERVRDYVLQRLWDVLSGKDTHRDFAHLSKEDRSAIREILLATRTNLPAYWR